MNVFFLFSVFCSRSKMYGVLVRNFDRHRPPPPSLLALCCDCCASHSGQWEDSEADLLLATFARNCRGWNKKRNKKKNWVCFVSIASMGPGDFNAGPIDPMSSKLSRHQHWRTQDPEGSRGSEDPTGPEDLQFLETWTSGELEKWENWKPRNDYPNIIFTLWSYNYTVWLHFRYYFYFLFLGHPRFFNQLSCGLDVVSLAGMGALYSNEIFGLYSFFIIRTFLSF